MRIGINAALLASGGGYRQTGVSRYISELARALAPLLAPNDDLCLLKPAMPPVGERPALRIPWEQAVLPVQAQRQRLDVLHGPLHVLPWLGGVPGVITVHDLAYVHFPERVPRSRRLYLTVGTRRSVGQARRVIAISTSTADDLRRWLGLPTRRIDVIPLAPAEDVQPVSGETLAAFRRDNGVTIPYVLCVGTLEPRKNLPRLLHAFAAIADDVPHQLILVGPEGWLTGELHATLADLRLGDRVRLTGFVDDRNLGAWYSGADLFVFPSLYEGFGLPPLEAMRCGAPVVTSNVSSLPEVVGDAAVTVDPQDVQGLATAMREVLTDRGRADELRARGVARAAEFSWARTARETLAVYRDAAK
ncbi:MAG: glycosyltransferase family 4 protein [Chloroflexota bacterium]|nr:glycosyltransferase family 4 protein [Chloroflexota bacterium]